MRTSFTAHCIAAVVIIFSLFFSLFLRLLVLLSHEKGLNCTSFVWPQQVLRWSLAKSNSLLLASRFNNKSEPMWVWFHDWGHKWFSYRSLWSLQLSQCVQERSRGLAETARQCRAKFDGLHLATEQTMLALKISAAGSWRYEADSVRHEHELEIQEGKIIFWPESWGYILPHTFWCQLTKWSHHLDKGEVVLLASSFRVVCAHHSDVRAERTGHKFLPWLGSFCHQKLALLLAW